MSRSTGPLKLLRAIPIDAPWMVERMRQIFNATLPALSTIPLTAKSAEEQQTWWNARDASSVRGFLYSPVAWPWEMVAFSLLTRRDGFTTPIFAVDPAFQGRGYGAEIIRHYIAEARGPLAAATLKGNWAASFLNQHAGWQVIGSTDEVFELFHPGAAIDAPAPAELARILVAVGEYHAARRALTREEPHPTTPTPALSVE